uniref:7TM GPCR serpentine receptor class x (Srx) domain-containing protein n=1 Tax=Panagrolaimus sp. PS1159 TaxID=55785 RepID=A0AC35GSP9_9BILA
MHPHLAHTINNISIILLLSCAYLTLCIILVKNRGPHSHIGRLQNQTFLQASIICGLNATAAVIYVIMQFFPTPIWLIIIGQITWQASHGAAVFIYLFLNHSLRDAALLMLRPEKFFSIKTKRNLKNNNNRKPTLSIIPTKHINESQILNSIPQLTEETISI